MGSNPIPGTYGDMPQLEDGYGSNPWCSGFDPLCPYFMRRCDKRRSQRTVNPLRKIHRWFESIPAHHSGVVFPSRNSMLRLWK